MTSTGECRGDRASAVRVGQDMVFRGLLTPLCAGYAPSEDQISEDRDLLRSFDDAVGWLFAYAGDALRDPFAPAPVTQVSVMTSIGLDVRVADWIEVRRLLFSCMTLVLLQPEWRDLGRGCR